MDSEHDQPSAETSFNNTLSPEDLGPSREAIERLENLQTQLSAKIDVLLVELGEKPATLHTFRSKTTGEGEEPGAIDEDSYVAYMRAVQDAGLLIEVGPDEVVDPNVEIHKGSEGAIWLDPNNPPEPEPPLRQAQRTVYMAKTPEGLDLMKRAHQENDAELLGQAYGFPPTSTQAHLQKRTVSPRTFDYDPAVLAFAGYGVSPENWEAELGVAKNWAEAIKAASPKLYAEMTAQSAG